MSQFETKCPHCGAALSVQDEWIGMNVECPQCKQEFPVQDNPVRLTPAAAAQTDNAGTFTFVCPSCNAVAELPNSLLGQQYECQICFETATAQATTEKQCPYCGQTVKYHAAVCKFCKADLTKAPPPSAPKPEETFVFICPECDTVEFLPVSMKGQQHECKRCCETSIAEPAEERKCPHCGEKIKIKAAICKHCKKAVKPLTPSPAGGAGVSQMLSGLKQTGAKFFGGSQNPRIQPISTPPPKTQPEYNNFSAGQGFWGTTEADAGFLRKIGVVLILGLCISAILSLAAGFSHWVRTLSWLPSIIFFVLYCIWIYKMWKQVPPAEAKTTPGKAVGFIFLPVYNIYWLLVMPGWLSKHYDQFNESRVSLQKWWQIYSGAVLFSCVFLPYVALTNKTSYADAQAAGEFFGHSTNAGESGVSMAFIAASVICSILNNALFINWFIRMWKSSQKIPRIG